MKAPNQTLSLVSDSHVRATIVGKFDLGLILRHPSGREGQLRVPEMTSTTREYDRSGDMDTALGVELGKSRLI